MGRAYEVVHVRAAGDQGADVVGPVRFDRTGAVASPRRAVPDLVVGCQNGRTGDPVVCLLGPVCVSLVAGVSCESCGELEESSVRNRVLVVVTSVEGVNLPSESSVAGARLPSQYLVIEYGLSQ